VVKRQAYVVDDLSVKGSPTVWGDVVIKAAVRHQAVIIAENNQGGALVRRMLHERAAARNVPPPKILEVWSSRAKSVRAEPIGAAYQRGRVHHLNVLPDLEDQLTSWTPADKGYSPDRLDAVVHGLSAVLFPEALVKGGVPGAAVSHPAAQAAGGARVPRQTELVARSGVTGRTAFPQAVQRRLGGLPTVAGPGVLVPRRVVPGRKP
jgi:hypothetical protein